MTQPDPLTVWDQTGEDVLEVIRELRSPDWSRPALPRWSVHDVVAHLAHLESVAAGTDETPMPESESSPDSPHLISTEVTQAGVDARAEQDSAQVVAELEAACVGRRERMAGLDTSDLSGPAEGIAGHLGWDMKTWLRNRAIDLWVHEQDIRRATGQPLRMTGVGAEHVARVMAAAFPVALRGLPAGTGVVACISGPAGRVLAARVGEGGRAAPFAAEEGSDLTLEMSDETWLLLTGGRIDPTHAEVTVTGDEALAATVLRQLNVTP